MYLSYLAFCRTHCPGLAPGSFAAQERLAEWQVEQLLQANSKTALQDLFYCMHGGGWLNEEGNQETCDGALVCAGRLIMSSRRAGAVDVGAFVSNYTRLKALLVRAVRQDGILERWRDLLYAMKPGDSMVDRMDRVEFTLGGITSVCAMTAAYALANKVRRAISHCRREARPDGEPYASETPERCPAVRAWARAASVQIRKAMPAGGVWARGAGVEGVNCRQRMLAEYMDIMRVNTVQPVTQSSGVVAPKRSKRPVKRDGDIALEVLRLVAQNPGFTAARLAALKSKSVARMSVILCDLRQSPALVEATQGKPGYSITAAGREWLKTHS